MNTLKNKLELHRYRNGREQIEYFSRQLRPAYSLIEIDGKFYDRTSLQKFIQERASNIVPETLRAMTAQEKNTVHNLNPWALFGKAKLLPKNIS
jgi:hypothetical protein